jgi:hypothetical protein
MNKIIRENYPAAQLPKDLRPSDDPNARVTIIVEEEGTMVGAAKVRRPLADFVGSAENVHGSPDEVLAHIRSLREDR